VPRWWRDATGAIGWLVPLGLTALWVRDGGVVDLGSLSGALTSTGRITGLIASALLLVQVLLMARVPVIEQAWGQDELARVHRLVGFTSFNLMVAHIVLITLGYAAASTNGLWGTIVDFTVNYPGMLLAIAGTVALCLVVVTSVRRARRRLRYESWHLLHLYAYVGAGLALPHQLWTGQSFLTSTTATVSWWTLWALAAGSVLLWRVALPLWRSWRGELRVSRVEDLGGGRVAVTVTGRVADLRAQGGQFFQWRFLDGDGWSRANPYSLSAAPKDRHLRFTAAVVGDGTARLAGLRPGARVLVEGPYGRMHAGTRTRRKVLLVGGGIGVTPMIALLESLPQHPGDVTLVHRVGTLEELVHSDEVSAIAAERGARYIVVDGHRMPGRDSWLPARAGALSDVEALRQICPDVADHEVYVCGAPAWMDAFARAARDAGVPDEHLHLERFEY
jgi:predicted ferric reductase